MQVRVIDDTGTIWDAESPAFREAFDAGWVEGDASPCLVDDMGFIRVRLSGSRTRIIEFNPGSVAKPAIAGLIRWLSNESPPGEQVCLAHGPAAGKRTHRIFGSILAALHELEALNDEARGGRPPFASLPDTLEEVDRVPGLAAAFAQWRASCGIFTEAEYRPLLSRHARDRFVIFAPRSSDGALSIVHAGSGLRIPNKQYHAGLNGTQLTDVADRAFGQWSSGMYRGVLERQVPRYDHIYAPILWPTVGRVAVSYSRLILPCRTKDGRYLLLGVNSGLATSHLDVEAT